jgi:hypothetical protein
MKSFLYFWLPTGTNNKKWRFVEFFILIFEIWRIWVNFLMENPSYRLKSYFSGKDLTKIRQ